jgi:hypothetical protein
VKENRMFAWGRVPSHIRIVAIGAALVAAGASLTGGPALAADEQSVPVYSVTQEGLTPDEGAKLAATFGVQNALQSNGFFSYVDPSRFGQVPLTATGQAGEDESGRPTVAQAVDFAALDKIKLVPDEVALRRGAQLLQLAALSPDLTARPTVSHTELALADREGRPTRTQPLDTAVSYQLNLAGLPVSGQGAKLRITVGPDGSVTQVSNALRKVERAGDVRVISVTEAAQACAALYGPEVRQERPTLGYQFPELTAVDAGGKGSVSKIFPQYTCNPVAQTGSQAHRLVPAVRGAAPAGKLVVHRGGDTVSAEVAVDGGTAPYTYRWSSSTTILPADQRDASAISYQRQPRERTGTDERVTVEVTDANGLTATATVDLPDDGTESAATVPGGGGFGALAIGPVDAGIEQTVDEWQCAQDSAIGFKNVMTSHGVGVPFDWRGANAWEWDFKDPSLGGGDDKYVDNVDAAWYTGHGWPGGFTFKSSVTDTSIVPGDARWGNRDLEWLQLESCQVLRDTTGTYDYFGRWRGAFQGLHILNGFHTNAYCVSGGTGGTFADYLFPKKFLWWTLRPAYRVQSAWAAMALDREPSGVTYRSMGLLGSGGVNNIGDYFWGQGTTGPDITPGTSSGMWSISGTV